MVKKIKRYAKFIVCVALIMGLIAPSYAALSASDGSAFVTKAEFDSALADFNARLTTFEAGINSKIDSQVTSYLDRNGIWNGKAQTVQDGYITSGNIVWFQGKEQNPKRMRWRYNDTNKYWMIQNRSTDTSNDWKDMAVNGEWGSYNWHEYMRCDPTSYNIYGFPIFFTCDKSGLVMARVVFTGSESIFRKKYYAQADANGNAGVFYWEGRGFLWSNAPITNFATKVAAANNKFSGQNAYILPTIPDSSVKSVFNQQYWINNFSVPGTFKANESFSFLFPDRTPTRPTAGTTEIQVSESDAHGHAINSGTFISTFFVKKGETIWMSKWIRFGVSVAPAVEVQSFGGLALRLADISVDIY